MVQDAEAEAVLRGPGEVTKVPRVEEVERRFGDRAAFALQILSKLYARTERAAKGESAGGGMWTLAAGSVTSFAALWLCYSHLSTFAVISLGSRCVNFAVCRLKLRWP